MEDMLAVYARPPQKDIQLVCLNEFAKQLLSEKRPPVAAIPGHLARADYEYVREGSVSGFMIAMPHLGKRDVFVGSDGRRTSKDFAACLEWKNKNPKPINWQFTNENARIKLKSLYPAI